jgi:hypothetical protein
MSPLKMAVPRGIRVLLWLISLVAKIEPRLQRQAVVTSKLGRIPCPHRYPL